jgi:hypothetical protein
MKHTVPDRTFLVQSVFNTPSTQAYEGYIIDTLAAGAVEIDPAGRTNLIWAAGEDVGFRFEAGQQLVIPQDAIKVVLSSDAGKVHAFSVHSSDFAGSRCPDCGRWAIVI